MSETRKRSISTGNFIILILMLAMIGLLPSHISVTLTPSLQHRVFLLMFNPDRADLKRGDYVMFAISKELIRQFTDSRDSDKTLKIVGCSEGSGLQVVNKDYFCEGEYLGTAKDVSLSGKRIGNYVFNGMIPKGKLFVVGQHKDSFDSRYFGLISTNDVIAKAYPLF